jgi:predicted Zn-dependent protease with MMP-like domain
MYGKLQYYRNMTSEEFIELVGQAWDSMPDSIASSIENVALIVEDEPDALVRREESLGEDETLLGLYRGVPLIERGGEYGVGPTLPDTITLYRLPIEDMAQLSDSTASPEDYVASVHAVITETLWHEVGHYLGLSEEEVEERENEGSNVFRSAS